VIEVSAKQVSEQSSNKDKGGLKLADKKLGLPDIDAMGKEVEEIVEKRWQEAEALRAATRKERSPQRKGVLKEKAPVKSSTVAEKQEEPEKTPAGEQEKPQESEGEWEEIPTTDGERMERMQLSAIMNEVSAESEEKETPLPELAAAKQAIAVRKVWEVQSKLNKKGVTFRICSAFPITLIPAHLVEEIQLKLCDRKENKEQGWTLSDELGKEVEARGDFVEFTISASQLMNQGTAEPVRIQAEVVVNPKLDCIFLGADALSKMGLLLDIGKLTLSKSVASDDERKGARVLKASSSLVEPGSERIVMASLTPEMEGFDQKDLRDILGMKSTSTSGGVCFEEDFST